MAHLQNNTETLNPYGACSAYIIGFAIACKHLSLNSAAKIFWFLAEHKQELDEALPSTMEAIELGRTCEQINAFLEIQESLGGMVRHSIAIQTPWCDTIEELCTRLCEVSAPLVFWDEYRAQAIIDLLQLIANLPEGKALQAILRLYEDGSPSYSDIIRYGWLGMESEAARSALDGVLASEKSFHRNYQTTLVTEAGQT
ncbi:hypothetical protein COV04_03555 [Candidatus Uhrbacteria bacterium CG10_big_fil_rev_8_21_14_0_10_48_11]|uniref:Uncharacterized protein n=1 Tax=Candidatus Uhrbacteria bacterium CG10_big_fil_rev_8_21_14_0_10_48_11 TaxID=1975037 RepID=A0A2M8LDZ1_9BACT|nr:MAG: hypothetical protein COV04_03555 [Candidatus Uhrbacteria bacterium CG10_big_fil_rev_8_21_14_0_10_48_11]